MQLAGRDRIEDEAHLALEHAPGHGIESDLGLVAGLHPLQGILLERRGELLVPRVGIDEHHDRPKRRRGRRTFPAAGPTCVTNPAAGARVTV